MNTSLTITNIYGVYEGAFNPGFIPRKKIGRHSDCFVYFIEGEIEYIFDTQIIKAETDSMLYLAKDSIYDINVEWVMGMKINSIILDAIKKNNNIITTEQVVKLGFSRYLLSKYEKEGLLDRERQGVYILPDAVHDDMYTLMLRSNKIVFSHDSALFLNGLCILSI